jgi:biotin carboxyl carrier protein
VRYEVEVNGQRRQVDVVRRDGQFIVMIDNREWIVDAVRVGGHVLSLLIEDKNEPAVSGNEPGRDRHGADDGVKPISSREIAVARDREPGQYVFGIGTLPVAVGLNTRRRRGAGSGAGQDGDGPQRIVAPMPGKIVRILGKAGDDVAPRQPVVVIEAMKMENELRAGRGGTIGAVFVQEGQSVEAGAPLAIINPS